MEMYLNKIMTVSRIDERTPRCVLLDILISHGYETDDPELHDLDLLEEVFKIQSMKISLPEEYGKLARYINYKCQRWSPKNLNLAYSHLHNYNPHFYSDSKSIFGEKTNEQPYNIDVCLTYRICLYYNFKLSKETTFQEMINMLKKMSIPPTFENLSAMYYSHKKDLFCQHLNYINDCQSILFVARGYGINIVPSNHYKEEFNSLAKMPADYSINKWQPYDANFKERYMFNPEFFKIYNFWTPLFNFLYSDIDISKFAEQEGIIFDDHTPRGELESKLQMARLVPTFYSGRIKHAEELTTISMMEIKNLNNLDTVSYGIYEDLDNKVYVYTFEELNDWFKSQRKFNIPERPMEKFSDQVIRKLKNILNVSNREMALHLRYTIDQIEEIYKNYSEEEQIFMEKYLKDSKMINLLQKVLLLGMYMRGWKVTISDRYPLKAEHTTSKEDQYEQIENNVQVNLLDILKDLEEDPSLSHDFKLIPLFINRETTNNHFERNTDPAQGLTLYERLQIIGTGSVQDSVYSCIRMSSNWIVATAYKYLILLHEPPDFDLKNMRYIT